MTGSSSGAGAASDGAQGGSGAASGGTQSSSSAGAASGGTQSSSGGTGGAGGETSAAGAAGGDTGAASGAGATSGAGAASGGAGGGTGEGTLLREAEDAALFGTFAIASDPGASGGKYVAVPAGVGCHGDEVRFTFDFVATGVYRIKTRVAEGPTKGVNNSFWVGIDLDDTPSEGYQYDIRGTEWHNDYAKDGKNNDRVLTFELDAGRHVVSFACREEQTRLDWIELERQR